LAQTPDGAVAFGRDSRHPAEGGGYRSGGSYGVQPLEWLDGTIIDADLPVTLFGESYVLLVGER
jgi:hypothetical protein